MRRWPSASCGWQSPAGARPTALRAPGREWRKDYTARRLSAAEGHVSSITLCIALTRAIGLRRHAEDRTTNGQQDTQAAHPTGSALRDTVDATGRSPGLRAEPEGSRIHAFPCLDTVAWQLADASGASLICRCGFSTRLPLRGQRRLGIKIAMKESLHIRTGFPVSPLRVWTGGHLKQVAQVRDLPDGRQTFRPSRATLPARNEIAKQFTKPRLREKAHKRTMAFTATS
ncbi:hypothetical protein OF001_U180032 [Pseudomonas sp. OF001]|nr:hypothetical protein OF001_U180032 [Pseudomonas sp. OF001]